VRKRRNEDELPLATPTREGIRVAVRGRWPGGDGRCVAW
jgi:hypothetical protein